MDRVGDKILRETLKKLELLDEHEG